MVFSSFIALVLGSLAVDPVPSEWRIMSNGNADTPVLWAKLSLFPDVDPTITDVVFGDSISPVLNGSAQWPANVDAICANIFITPARAQFVDFSVPTSVVDSSVIVPVSSTVTWTSLLQRPSLSVGSVLGTLNYALAKSNLSQMVGGVTRSVIGYQTDDEVNEALRSGAIAAAVVDSVSAPTETRTLKVLQSFNVGCALKKGSSRLAQLNALIAKATKKVASTPKVVASDAGTTPTAKPADSTFKPALVTRPPGPRKPATTAKLPSAKPTEKPVVGTRFLVGVADVDRDSTEALWKRICAYISDDSGESCDYVVSTLAAKDISAVVEGDKAFPKGIDTICGLDVTPDSDLYVAYSSGYRNQTIMLAVPAGKSTTLNYLLSHKKISVGAVLGTTAYKVASDIFTGRQLLAFAKAADLPSAMDSDSIGAAVVSSDRLPEKSKAFVLRRFRVACAFPKSASLEKVNEAIEALDKPRKAKVFASNEAAFSAFLKDFPRYPSNYSDLSSFFAQDVALKMHMIPSQISTGSIAAAEKFAALVESCPTSIFRNPSFACVDLDCTITLEVSWKISSRQEAPSTMFAVKASFRAIDHLIQSAEVFGDFTGLAQECQRLAVTPESPSATLQPSVTGKDLSSLPPDERFCEMAKLQHPGVFDSMDCLTYRRPVQPQGSQVINLVPRFMYNPVYMP